MSGIIQGPTSGSGDPTSTGNTTGASSGASGGPPVRPATPSSHPALDALPGKQGLQGYVGSSWKRSDSSEWGAFGASGAEAADAMPKAQQHLVQMGFSSDQLAEIISARSRTGDAGRVFSMLPFLCDDFGLNTQYDDPEVGKEQDAVRAQLVSFAKAAGADGLILLDVAFSYEPPARPEEFAELCELLQRLGATFGHPYRQLTSIARSNFGVLRELRDTHELLIALVGEESQRRRVPPLGVLAHRGGVDALRAFMRVILASPDSYSIGQFDDTLKAALHESGLTEGEVNRLFR